jgi:hypothetical protein
MYIAYHIDHIPDLLSAKYPKHAVYGSLAIFGESLEELTRIPLPPEKIRSYIDTPADENYMIQLVEESEQEQTRLDAREVLRSELQELITQPDNREIRVTTQQGKILYKDWMELQPDEAI